MKLFSQTHALMHNPFQKFQSWLLPMLTSVVRGEWQGCQIKLVSILFSFWSRCCRNHSISIRYQFDSKYDLIQYISTSAVIKFNWPSMNWPISKRLFTRMTEILENLIWHSIFWNYHFFYHHGSEFSRSHFLPHWIELYQKSKKSFDSICIRFDSISAKTFDWITKYDSISIRSDSPGGDHRTMFSRFGVSRSFGIGSFSPQLIRIKFISGFDCSFWRARINLKMSGRKTRFKLSCNTRFHPPTKLFKLGRLSWSLYSTTRLENCDFARFQHDFRPSGFFFCQGIL